MPCRISLSISLCVYVSAPIPMTGMDGFCSVAYALRGGFVLKHADADIVTKNDSFRPCEREKCLMKYTEPYSMNCLMLISDMV